MSTAFDEKPILATTSIKMPNKWREEGLILSDKMVFLQKFCTKLMFFCEQFKKYIFLWRVIKYINMEFANVFIYLILFSLSYLLIQIAFFHEKIYPFFLGAIVDATRHSRHSPARQ
jgi:hypothetical protein